MSPYLVGGGKQNVKTFQSVQHKIHKPQGDGFLNIFRERLMLLETENDL